MLLSVVIEANKTLTIYLLTSVGTAEILKIQTNFPCMTLQLNPARKYIYIHLIIINAVFPRM